MAGRFCPQLASAALWAEASWRLSVEAAACPDASDGAGGSSPIFHEPGFGACSPGGGYHVIFFRLFDIGCPWPESLESFRELIVGQNLWFSAQERSPEGRSDNSMVVSTIVTETPKKYGPLKRTTGASSVLGIAIPAACSALRPGVLAMRELE